PRSLLLSSARGQLFSSSRTTQMTCRQLYFPGRHASREADCGAVKSPIKFIAIVRRENPECRLLPSSLFFPWNRLVMNHKARCGDAVGFCSLNVKIEYFCPGSVFPPGTHDFRGSCVFCLHQISRQ